MSHCNFFNEYSFWKFERGAATNEGNRKSGNNSTFFLKKCLIDKNVITLINTTHIQYSDQIRKRHKKYIKLLNEPQLNRCMRQHICI